MSKYFRKKSFEERRQISVDFWLAASVIILVSFGVVMVYNSSVAIAVRDFSDKYYYAREQLRWLIIGLISLIFFARIDYRRWRQAALPLMVVTVALLILVFIPGFGYKAYGAYRWIKIFFINFQPAELAKLSLVIYLSVWLSSPEKNRLGAFLLLIGALAGLIVAEPDLGTAIVLGGTGILMFFGSGAPVREVIAVLAGFSVTGIFLAVLAPYRLNRIMTFLNPDSDPLGASYQIRQALLAIGSGGIFGLGLGKSRQKYEYLPEANTDSIFAIIAEETGIFGSVILLAFLLFVIWRGIRIARRQRDPFGRLLALGITGWFGVQSLLNISAIVGIMPLTGIPLPLVSYGGSSLVITMTALGILLNISK
jgi:cell division protein FtsW